MDNEKSRTFSESDCTCRCPFGESWTYATLQNRIIGWVSFFNRNGYKKGERIAIVAPNSPELFAILFACELTGLFMYP